VGTRNSFTIDTRTVEWVWLHTNTIHDSK